MFDKLKGIMILLFNDLPLQGLDPSSGHFNNNYSLM